MPHRNAAGDAPVPTGRLAPSSCFAAAQWRPSLRHDRRAGGLRRRPRPGARGRGDPASASASARRLQPLRDGPRGLGRHTIVRRFLEQRAPQRATPVGLVLRLQFRGAATSRARSSCRRAGAPRSGEDMERLVEDLRTGIPAAFETDEYRTRLQEIESEFEERHEKAIEAIGENANAAGHRAGAHAGRLRLRADARRQGDEPGGVPRAARGEQKRVQEAIARAAGGAGRVIQSCRSGAARRSASCASSNRQVTRDGDQRAHRGAEGRVRASARR